MEAFVSTLLSTLVAFVVAIVGGSILGRLASGSLASVGLLSRLTEMRGALPLFLLAPLLAGGLQASGIRVGAPWIVGGAVGFYQAIAVARWFRRRSGSFAPSLLGGMALGQSRVALAARRAAVSGSVWVTVAQCALHVVMLEAVLALFHLAPHGPSLGAAFAPGGAASVRALAVVSTILLLLAVDFGSARLFRNGR